jgi:hypothetical protein
MNAAARRRAFGACLLVLVYLLLTLLFTFPLAANFGSHHAGEEAGDAKVYLWSYWWTKRALDSGESPFETDVIFHPIGIGLAFHTLAFSQGLTWSALSSFFGDVEAANAIVLWTFLASALATYALARKAGASPAGAFLAGVVFAFCPFRLSRLSGHYDLLGTEWIPLYALAALTLADREQFPIRLAIAAGIVAGLCGYTALTYFVFLSFFTALLLVREWRRPALVLRFAAVFALASLLLFPLFHQAFVDRTSWTYLPYPGVDRYVADAVSYVLPTPRQNVLGGVLGRVFDPNLSETTVFAGYSAIGLSAFGLYRWKRIPGISFWLASAAIFFVLSLGTSLHVFGSDTGIPLPFRILTGMPLLEDLRAPSRFAVMTMLSLAVVAGVVWTRLSREWPRRTLATAAAGALVVSEYLALPAPIFEAGAHPIYREIAREGDALTLVEIPGIEQAPVETMYHQTLHGKPIFVGTAARVPREKSEYYLGLPLVRPLIDLRKGKLEIDDDLLARERESAPEVARFLNLGYVVIDRAFEKRGVLRFVEEVLPVDRWYEDEAVVVLRTRRNDLPPDPSAIDAGTPQSRQHFESGWLPAEPDETGAGGSFRWANRGTSTILFRRPSPSVESIALSLAPLEGLSLSVEVRLDGRNLGVRELTPGFQEVAIPLPETEGESPIERLSLHWSSLREASERDPRRLAARVRWVRLR